MSIPLDHIKERLSLSYVSAIVARAGAACRPVPSPEYGTDAYIIKINKLPNGKVVETGVIIPCQIKSTTKCEFNDDSVIYDMEVDSYNKLIEWEGIDVLLIVFCLPKNDDEWVSIDENQLVMKNCSYWIHLSGTPSPNKSSQRIFIPRSQIFTPESVKVLLERVRENKGLKNVYAAK